MNDSPDKKSADWQAMSEYWESANDLVCGAKKVRDAGERYLPKFPNETNKDYEFRRKTAKYTNVYLDILEGLAQKPFSKEVSVKDDVPERFKPLIEDIDGRGNHLHVFAGTTFFCGINNAIDWILVDYTKTEGLKTVEEERKAGVRPYWVHIPADKVIWIDSKVIEGREQLTKIKIQEEKNRIRTYEREEAVTWKVEEEDSEGHWQVVDNGVITIGIIPMVPFIAGRRKGPKWQFDPPMRGAVDLQIELYQQETSLKYIETLTCFPMLAGNGVSPDTDADGAPKPVPVGPAAVLYAPPNADGSHGEWRWIGTDAACLQFLADQIKATKQDLRELGRQPLTAQSGNLTVITTAFAAQKGNSAVQSWALNLKDALELALSYTALWLGETYQPEVFIYTDFGIEDADDKSMDHLLKMREQGDLSQETLWEESKRRGLLSAEFDSKVEIEERLFNELPSGDE